VRFQVVALAFRPTSRPQLGIQLSDIRPGPPHVSPQIVGRAHSVQGILIDGSEDGVQKAQSYADSAASLEGV